MKRTSRYFDGLDVIDKTLMVICAISFVLVVFIVVEWAMVTVEVFGG